jgi:CRP-like cAMP-binding protein
MKTGVKVDMIDTGLLRTMPYFTGLGEAELAAVSGRIFEKKAERGEILSFEGEPAESIYTVVSGVVKTYKTSADGKEQIFRIVRPGGTFNDAPVLGDSLNLVTAEAMSSVDLYGIKQADLAVLIAEYPAIAHNAIVQLSRRVQELVALVEDFSFLHVTGRVAKMLLTHIRPDGAEHPRLTQQEMAALIGTAREMVGRSLKNLEEEGIIRMERNRIFIADEEALRRMAGVAS